MRSWWGIDWDGPTPEPSWQQELERIAPRSDDISWLLLRWEPGDPWERAERWVVWQMRPFHRANPMVRQDLVGRSPRDRGRFDRVLGEFVPDPDCNVSLQQWRLYRETGCYGTPYWIVQGRQGGHKRRWDRVESALIRMHTQTDDPDPPAIGDLPYCPFDQRVVQKLELLDRVKLAKITIDMVRRNPDIMDADDQRARAELEDQIVGWMRSQMQPHVEELSYHMKNELELNPVATHRRKSSVAVA